MVSDEPILSRLAVAPSPAVPLASFLVSHESFFYYDILYSKRLIEIIPTISIASCLMYTYFHIDISSAQLGSFKFA